MSEQVPMNEYPEGYNEKYQYENEQTDSDLEKDDSSTVSDEDSSDDEGEPIVRIYCLSDGESWSKDGEVRFANEDDVKFWSDEEYMMTLGDIISVTDVDGNQDFMHGNLLTRIFVTEKEFVKLSNGMHPRQLYNFYGRCEDVDDPVHAEAEQASHYTIFHTLDAM